MHGVTQETEMGNSIFPNPGIFGGKMPLTGIFKEGIMAVTPVHAERAITEGRYERQRPTHELDYKVYARIMDFGLWGTADPISFCLLGEELILINGYNRCKAIIEHGKPVLFRIAVDRVYNEDELNRRYYLYDTLLRKRSTSDVLRSMDLVNKEGVSSKMATGVYNTAGIIMNGFKMLPDRKSSSDASIENRLIDARVHACATFWDAARKLDPLFKKADKDVKDKLYRASTLCIALITMKHMPMVATDFWGGLAADSGLLTTDIRKVLLRDLKFRRLNAVSNEGIYAAAEAWNVFSEGLPGRKRKPLEKLEANTKLRLRIAGTPLDGSR